jgi:hypothetical protein
MLRAAMISFIPIIVVTTLFASYVALTPTSTTIYSMPPPNTVTSASGQWKFTAMTSQGEMVLGVSANLTFTGRTNATYDFGDPLILCEVQASNGTLVWAEITTELLRMETVTPGQLFSDDTQVPTSQLILGQTYTLLVFPQVSASGFSGHSLQVKFTFSPLA